MVANACPQCGKEASFKPRKREPQPGLLELVIACPYCPWEQVIRSGPKTILELELDIEALEMKVRQGVPLHDVLARRRERLEQERLKPAIPG